MSDLDEPRIRCPSCGKLAPTMKYCIYCGARLPQAAPPTVPTPQPILPPTAPPTVQPPALVIPSMVPVEVKDEITTLMSDIRVLFEREAALLNLFQLEQISEKVFLKLFNEYSGKLTEYLNTRSGKIEEQKNKLNEGSRKLSDIAVTLEELEVRHRIGDIDTNTYNQKTESLKTEEHELIDSVRTLKTNIDRLNRAFADKKPSEIRDLEAKMRSNQNAIRILTEGGKVSERTNNVIKSEIEKTTSFLGSLIKDRKDKEKELREQLETLQTRYKLSELSIEEYEKNKRDIQMEIDKIWA